MVYVAITTVTSERFHHPQIGPRAPISSCSPPTHTVHPNSDQPPCMADLCFCNHIASNHSCLASFTRLKAFVGHLPCSVYHPLVLPNSTTPGRYTLYFVIYSPSGEHLCCFPFGKIQEGRCEHFCTRAFIYTCGFCCNLFCFEAR